MAKRRFPLVINAIDFSAYANRRAYSVSYVDRVGPNSGIMLDGTETYDLQSKKALISWPLNDLPSEKLSLLMQACQDKYVAVTFFDPVLNRERPSVFIPAISAATGNNPTASVLWFTGQVLTLRER